MRKILLIALKDLALVFRDRTALLFMLLAPLALTVGLGLATGSFSSRSDSGILDLPVAVVNEDANTLGNALVEMLQSDELADLLEPQVMTDLDAARRMVDENQLVAVIWVPAGFSKSIILTEGQYTQNETIQVEIYENPTAPTSVGIVRNIVEQFMSQVEKGRISGQVTVTQLLESGAIDISQAEEVGRSIGEEQGQNMADSSITLRNVTANGNEVNFNMLAVLAPGMALMFLMFTVSNGGRSLLVEQSGGTLPRLLVSPTSTIQVLSGKVFGIFLSGMAQMLILVTGTALLFKLDWGSPLLVFVIITAAALAATGWGILLAALFKTPGQVSSIGTAIMLIFGILGGSFTNIAIMPAWVQAFSRISPNRWALDGFTTLAMGGTFLNIVIPVVALLIMAVILFLISVILFSRRGIGKR